ncbi:MAG: efflux RND transporter periplasmic adaptor subunit, partial [Elusimicrobiota bacterium]|nr:efflux RND transporter periplasmic adaptor subunit [Elusimicrobiota bacterium]
MDIGETVEIGMQKTPIFEVASIDEVKVAASIAEKDITKVKKGLPVRFTVDAYPDKFFYGEVSRISQTIDLQSRTVQIEIFVSNKNGLLKPGMFAKVNIIVSTHKNALTIPVDAIGEFDSEKYVFVVINSIVHRKNIKTGISQNQDVEVLDGLTETDDVISVGWQNLTDKMQVEVIEK